MSLHPPVSPLRLLMIYFLGKEPRYLNKEHHITPHPTTTLNPHIPAASKQSIFLAMSSYQSPIKMGTKSIFLKMIFPTLTTIISLKTLMVGRRGNIIMRLSSGWTWKTNLYEFGSKLKQISGLKNCLVVFHKIFTKELNTHLSSKTTGRVTNGELKRVSKLLR